MIAISSSRRANLPGHAMIEAAKEFILFQRIQPDQDHHAIAEENGDAIFVDAKRQRHGGKNIAALET